MSVPGIYSETNNVSLVLFDLIIGALHFILSFGVSLSVDSWKVFL